MDAKTFVIPDGNGGLDPNLLLNMNGGMGAWGNSPLWALIFLSFLSRGFGNWGFDGINPNGGCNCGLNNQIAQIQETLNTTNGNQMLMNAITQNGVSVKELATALNCDFNAVQTAINGIQTAIGNLGSKNDMNAMQIVNAINGGNASLANQLSSCCCDVKQLVTTQGYEGRLQNLQQGQLIQAGFNDTNVALERGFANVGFATQSQTTALSANADANTRSVLAKLDQIEDSRKDREIASLTAQLTAATSRAERAAELAPVYQALNDIKAKQPNTVPIQWPQLTAIPTSQFYGYGPWGGQFG